MTNTQRLAQVREQAIALRRAGTSRREIKEILRIGSNETLNNALRGEPPGPVPGVRMPKTPCGARLASCGSRAWHTAISPLRLGLEEFSFAVGPRYAALRASEPGGMR